MSERYRVIYQKAPAAAKSCPEKTQPSSIHQLAQWTLGERQEYTLVTRPSQDIHTHTCINTNTQFRVSDWPDVHIYIFTLKQKARRMFLFQLERSRIMCLLAFPFVIGINPI